MLVFLGLGVDIVLDISDGTLFGWCCFVERLLGRLGNKPIWKVKRSWEVQNPLTLVLSVLAFFLLLVLCVLLLGSVVFVVVIVFDIHSAPVCGAAFPSSFCCAVLSSPASLRWCCGSFFFLI